MCYNKNLNKMAKFVYIDKNKKLCVNLEQVSYIELIEGSKFCFWRFYFNYTIFDPAKNEIKLAFLDSPTFESVSQAQKWLDKILISI